MSGLTGLVDLLLADKLSQRPDLARAPSAAVVSPPMLATAVQSVGNDVRLRADAALQRPLGPGAAAPAAAREPEAAPVLSLAGRTISRVLDDLRSPAGPVQSAAPLLPAPPLATAPSLAAALADAVAASGLCYESHLAAFAAGELAREQLEREPQARAGRRARGGADDAMADAARLQRPAGTPADAQAGDGASAPPVLLPRTLSIVHQQLEVLATGVFRFSGEAWPGVPLEWEVADGAERDAGAGARETSAPWTTRVTLDLPRLGTVSVHLALDGARVAARVVAPPPAVAALRGAAFDLQDGWARLGLQPQFVIESGEAPP